MNKHYRFDYTEEDWRSLKRRLVDLLIEKARKGSLITYKELAIALDPEKLTPDSVVLFSLLYEVTREEYLQGNGLLSAVVVKSGPIPFPGDGFFKCAEECGKKVYGKQRFWIRELKHVYSLHRDRMVARESRATTPTA